MRNTTIFMVMSIAGFSIAVAFGYVTGDITGAMGGIIAGIFCLLPTFELIMIANNKRFLPLFWNLEEENGIKKEKYVFIPDTFGRIRLAVAQMVSDGVLFIKKKGLIDDKGSEYMFGNSPVSFVQLRLGFTKNLKQSQYHHLLKNRHLFNKQGERRKDTDEKLDDINYWDEAVKKYLGHEKYIEFCKLFRNNPEPDSAAIQAELQWLKDIKNPADQLAIVVAGETLTFHDDIEFFQYNYLPEYMKVYVEQVKINVRREEQGYKDPSKAMNWAKAAAIILIVVMVVIIALASVDLSKLGSFFGIGAKTVTPVIVNNSTVVHP